MPAQHPIAPRKRSRLPWTRLARGGRVLPLLMFSILLCSAARAGQDDSPDSQPVVLEKVTVTANKIEEDLSQVPQSITVIDETVLEEKGIRTVPDLIKEIPNMTANRSAAHGAAVNFRGLNPSTFTNNNPVVIYIDGVASSGREAFDASLANVERVEVLRGPQGTIYGKDAIGAVINIVTKKPENAWHGKIGTEYGSENHARGQFNANGALLEDKVYLGVNGQFQQDDGWIENEHPGGGDDFNTERDRRINANLTVTPTDKFTARLSVTNEYNKINGLDGYGLPGGTPLDAFSRDDAKHVDMDEDTKVVTENNAQSLSLAYDFDAFSVSSVTTHKNLDLDGRYDADFSNDPLYAGLLQFNYSDIENTTEELRFSSNDQDGARWVAGLYFDTERREQGPYGMQFPGFDPTTFAFLGNFEMDAHSNTDSDTYAVFGQVIVPFAERFELTLGGRFQRVEKKIDLSAYYLPVGATGPAMYELDAEKSWNAFLPKAALSYRLSDAWNTYVSYSKGYMPGGFNYFASSGGADDNTFEPQVSSNYEWGVKGTFERGSAALALFRMDIEDIHVYKAVGNIWITDNAKKAHSQGAELEFTYRPFDSIELSGAMGLIEAKYDDYDYGAGDFDGENIEQTPSHAIRFGVAYTHPCGLYGRVDVKNQGRMYFYDDANKDFAKTDAYTLVDAKIGYRLQDWDIYAYVKNLTDEEYVTMFMSSSMLSLATFGDPRTVGVGVNYHF